MIKGLLKTCIILSAFLTPVYAKELINMNSNNSIELSVSSEFVMNH